MGPKSKFRSRGANYQNPSRPNAHKGHPPFTRLALLAENVFGFPLDFLRTLPPAGLHPPGLPPPNLPPLEGASI